MRISTTLIGFLLSTAAAIAQPVDQPTDMGYCLKPDGFGKWGMTRAECDAVGGKLYTSKKGFMTGIPVPPAPEK